MSINLKSDVVPSGLVKIHIGAFENFFLTTLGEDFLETYYQALIQSKDGVLISIFEGDELVGFAAGTVNMRGFHKRLLRNNVLPFLQVLLKKIFLSPSTIVRLFKNLSKGSDEDFIDYQTSELLSIAVKPNLSGKGYGRKVLKEFETQVFAKGVKSIVLTTDVLDNASTVSFYKKNGYIVFSEFKTYPNRQMYRMKKCLE